MKHDHYSIEDLLLNEDFRRWILYPDRENQRFWEKWIAEDTTRRRLVGEARDLLMSAEFDEVKIYENKNRAMWERLNNQIEENERREQYSQMQRKGRASRRHRKGGYKILYRAAAVFIGILALGAAYYFIHGETTHTYVTRYGEIKTVTLPDSSLVTLNAHSTLKLKADWNAKKAREVWIEGEAFFQVRKNPNAGNAVFIVHANHLDVEVLGTTFDVHNRREQPRVILNSGKVKLKMARGQGGSIIMKPGELAEFSTAMGGFTAKPVEAENYTSWRNNQLIFNGSSIREIGRLLEDNYGYTVIVKDPGIAERKFKGKFPANNPDILLTALSESFNLKVIKKDKQIIIENY